MSLKQVWHGVTCIARATQVIEDGKCCCVPGLQDLLCLLPLLLAGPAATGSLCSQSPLVLTADSVARPARRQQCVCTGQTWLAGWKHHTGTARLLPLLPLPAVPSAEHACLQQVPAQKTEMGVQASKRG